MTQKAPLPRELGDVFAVAAARTSGVAVGRLNALDLEAPFHGARRQITTAPNLDRFALRDFELRSLCAAYLPVAPQGAVFSHVSAARLFRMPVPERLVTTLLDVSTAAQPPRRVGVRGHRSQDSRRREVDGLPTVPPALAWLELAPLLTLDELIVAGDHLVRRKRPLCSLAEIAQELADSRGRRGLANARSAFGQLRANTDSPPESWMRLCIVRAGYPEPLVGYPAHHDGYFIGTPDLAYPQYRIAYEYQGAGHREKDEFESDILRLELFHDAGWKVIQVTNQLLWSPGWLAEQTRRALLARGWRPRVQK